LKKENLRDDMTNTELVLNMLAELSTKNISESSNPKTLKEHKVVAKRGGNIAGEARKKLEKETGNDVSTPVNPQILRNKYNRHSVKNSYMGVLSVLEILKFWFRQKELCHQWHESRQASYF
jgi:hypothetical protein